MFERERQALLSERAQIASRLRRNGRYGLDQSLGEGIGELSGYDQHPADIGSEVFEREKDLALKEFDDRRLDQIENALARMDVGEYGACEVCGGSIAAARLDAEPATSLCIRCEQERDSSAERPLRPVEEEVLSPPFARSNRDGDDFTGFDGEDAIQATLRMSTPDAMADDELFSEGDGYVEATDAISNDQYKAQLPD